MMKKSYKKRSSKKGPVISKKVFYDGINFASGLEKYMYIAYKKLKLNLNTKEKLLYYLTVFILKTKFMKDNLMVKDLI